MAIILNLISKTYFKCGQKTSQEELAALTSSFMEEMEDYTHLTFHEIENIFKNGYKKVYGEYFGLNVKTFITWVDHYDKNLRNEELAKLRSLDPPVEQKTISEEEKQFWINKGVTECLEYFENNGSIMNGKLYVYDILYDMGYLPTDLAYKKKIKQDAIDVIEFEQKSKRPSSLDEKKEIAFILDDILKPKSGILISKCKELVLLEFLRKLYWDSEKVMELKEKFENK